MKRSITITVHRIRKRVSSVPGLFWFMQINFYRTISVFVKPDNHWLPWSCRPWPCSTPRGGDREVACGECMLLIWTPSWQSRQKIEETTRMGTMFGGREWRNNGRRAQFVFMLQYLEKGAFQIIQLTWSRPCPWKCANNLAGGGKEKKMVLGTWHLF